MKCQILDGCNVETGIKFRNCCFHHHYLFSGVYLCIFIWWRFLFKNVTGFLVFQWNSTMGSTTSNNLINVKPNRECCLLMNFVFFLVRMIDMCIFITTTKYKFPLWKYMSRLIICAHCSIFHIRRFGINMTPMWHHCIFIWFIYVMYFSNRPYALSILDFIL